MARAFVKRPEERIALLRQSAQLAFLLLNLWIGAQFYLWVRYFETEGTSVYVSRPPGVEGWLPIAALMNLKYFVVTGAVPGIHAAGMFLLLAFLGASVLFRKAFCSWLCPIGTVSEWLWQGGAAVFGRSVKLPRLVDVPLRGLKYVLLALFAWAVASMSADDVRGFMQSPYGLLADVKLLDFFRSPGRATIAVCSALVILSVLTRNVWCRYLCPYGALMGIAALASPLRITRDPMSCIDCGKCANACPSGLPVDVLRTVRTAECTGCMTCVSVCPVKDALEMRTVIRRRRVAPAAFAAGVLGVFLLVVGYARVSGAWAQPLPEHLFFELIPQAGAIGHP